MKKSSKWKSLWLSRDVCLRDGLWCPYGRWSSTCHASWPCFASSKSPHAATTATPPTFATTQRRWTWRTPSRCSTWCWQPECWQHWKGLQVIVEKQKHQYLEKISYFLSKQAHLSCHDSMWNHRWRTGDVVRTWFESTVENEGTYQRWNCNHETKVGVFSAPLKLAMKDL